MTNLTNCVRRRDKSLLAINEEGLVGEIRDFKSINAAKKANRGNMTPGLKRGDKMPKLAKDAFVEELNRNGN